MLSWGRRVFRADAWSVLPCKKHSTPFVALKPNYAGPPRYIFALPSRDGTYRVARRTTTIYVGELINHPRVWISANKSPSQSLALATEEK